MRYFFHYRDADHYFIDSEGTELVDLAAARAEGRQSIRELLGEDGAVDPHFVGGSYEISDQEGAVLAVIPFDDARA